MKLYLGNKMVGIPYFNAPWFDRSAAILEGLDFEVFNPAAHDRAMGFDPMSCPNGSPEESEAAGFCRQDALGFDWSWIAHHSEGLVIGPDWARSTGTISEIACHQALGLPVWEYATFIRWHDPRARLRCFKLDDLALRPLLTLGGPEIGFNGKELKPVSFGFRLDDA